MSNYLVCEGCTLKATPGTATITVAACITLPKLKCKGKAVYNTIVFTVSDGSYTGGGSLLANSTKVKSQGLACVLDNATVAVTLTSGSSTEPCTVSVLSAGQTKVKGI